MSVAHDTLSKQATAPLILIVDDEVSICRTLEGVLGDEGYATMVAHDGESALRMVSANRPALVILDIWMRGMDGLECLELLRQHAPGLPVIMVSGHATIATAVRSTRLGALDFIEKPLDLDILLRAVRRALDASQAGNSAAEFAAAESFDLFEIGKSGKPGLNPVVFHGMPLASRALVQKTLKHSALLYGQGLHTGTKSGLILEPLPANSGIHFAGVSEHGAVPAHLDFVESTGYATTIKLGAAQVATIEHLMSALCAYGISNLLIKCNGEVPVMDGSALEFCNLIEQIGLQEQAEPWHVLEIREPICVGTPGKEYIQIEPHNGFVVDYTLSYPQPVGQQRMVFELSDPALYKSLIAPARTFGFVKDIGWLQQQGLALGGRFDNFVLFGDSGPINCKLRFADEPVRHKILDLLGDLFLLGRRIHGRITACMTGHSDNIALLKEIQLQLLSRS